MAEQLFKHSFGAVPGLYSTVAINQNILKRLKKHYSACAKFSQRPFSGVVKRDAVLLPKWAHPASVHMDEHFN